MQRKVTFISQCFLCHFCYHWNIFKIVKSWSFVEFRGPFRGESSAKRSRCGGGGGGEHVTSNLGQLYNLKESTLCCFFVPQIFYVHEERNLQIKIFAIE